MTGTSDTSSGGFQTLDGTGGDLVAVRVGRATREGYERFYRQLAELTRQHGSARVYEEAPGWTGAIFLSNALRGAIPDLRYGSRVTVSRYAAVGDSRWLKLLYTLASGVKRIWPMAPREMRHFSWNERAEAWEWVRAGQQ